MNPSVESQWDARLRPQSQHLRSQSQSESESPSAYRQKNPYNPPPPEYKPPSMLAEHKGLAIAFALVSVAIGAYCLKAPHAPAAHAARGLTPAAAAPQSPGVNAPPTQGATKSQPIYIETIPDTRK